MKVVKIVGINFIIIAVLLCGIELFFQLNVQYSFLPVFRSHFILPTNGATISSDAVKILGLDFILNVPEKYKIKQDPRVLRYQFKDIDHQNKYPKDYWENRENRTYHVVEKIKNTDLVVYDVFYKFDSSGFRYVENQEQKRETDKFFIAAGDSFTFGEGNSQGFDYPSQLASKLNSSWKVYNYGVQGYGPNDFVKLSQENDYLEKIKEKKGVFVWVYIDSHMQRMICPIGCTDKKDESKYIMTKPEYALEDGKVVYYGPFRENNRPLRKIVNFFNHSETLSYFGWDYPALYTYDSFKLFFALLNEGLSKFKKQHLITKKYLVLFDSNPNYPSLKKAANEAEFEVIKMGGDDFPGQFRLGIIPDGHPSSDYHWILSDLLKRKIQ